MDDLTVIETADIHFAKLQDAEGDILIVAIGAFGGITKVGCGTTRKDALFDLFANAMPGKTMKVNPFVAMRLGEIDETSSGGQKDSPRSSSRESDGS